MGSVATLSLFSTSHAFWTYPELSPFHPDEPWVTRLLIGVYLLLEVETRLLISLWILQRFL